MGFGAAYEIQVLKVGESDVPGPEVYWMDRWDKWVTLNFYMVLARSAEHTVLINSGAPRDLTELNARWGGLGERAKLRRTENEWTENALARVGVRPCDVDYLLITPLQAYATANIPLFTNATICMSRRGWIEDYHAPTMPLHVPRHLRVSDDVMKYLMFDAQDRVRLLADEEEIVPGITTFWTGGHHRSSVAYVIEGERDRVAVSDCCFVYDNVEGEMHALGIAESLPECFSAYRRMRAESDIIVPLYEPKVLERFPNGVIANGE